MNRPTLHWPLPKLFQVIGDYSLPLLLAAVALCAVPANAAWLVQQGATAGPTSDPATVIYSESASLHRLSLLKPAGSSDLILLFSIPAASGMPMQLDRLTLQIDEGPMIPLGKLALAAWETDSAHAPYPMTANGQTFSLRVGLAHIPARQDALLRRILEGKSMLIRYYRTNGRGMDIRFPLAGLASMVVQYFDVSPISEPDETVRLARCSKRFDAHSPKWLRCLGKFAPLLPIP